jgi:hypothetical protein
VIDPSIKAVLRSRYTIRRFFMFYGLILVVSFALLSLAAALPTGSSIRELSATFFSHFAATVAILIVTYAFYVFVTPPGLRDAEVIPLRSGEIAEEIADLRTTASDYWFWGRSGSYFRSAVLPRLDEAARKDRRHVNLHVLVPDPVSKNSVLYASMRRGLGEEADEHTLAANVLATVFATVTAAACNPYLHARIGLCATVPVLRYDLSSTGALITRDARSLPAVLVNSGNPYFEMFRDAIENELTQSRPLTWDPAASVFHQAGDVSIEDALSAIDGLSCGDQAALSTAKTLLASKAHRYA